MGKEEEDSQERNDWKISEKNLRKVGVENWRECAKDEEVSELEVKVECI